MKECVTGFNLTLANTGGLPKVRYTAWSYLRSSTSAQCRVKVGITSTEFVASYTRDNVLRLQAEETIGL